MPYYHDPKTGDTGFVDLQGRQWELAPGGKGLPVQYRDFTEADLARTGGGHFGLLAGEVDPGLFAGGGVGNRPTFEGAPNASAYLVPRINGMNMLDYLQSKGRPTGVVVPGAAGVSSGVSSGVVGGPAGGLLAQMQPILKAMQAQGEGLGGPVAGVPEGQMVPSGDPSVIGDDFGGGAQGAAFLDWLRKRRVGRSRVGVGPVPRFE